LIGGYDIGASYSFSNVRALQFTRRCSRVDSVDLVAMPLLGEFDSIFLSGDTAAVEYKISLVG